jgi:hypothetical protein
MQQCMGRSGPHGLEMSGMRFAQEGNIGIVASGEGGHDVLEEKVPTTAQRFPDYVQNGRSGEV